MEGTVGRRVVVVVVVVAVVGEVVAGGGEMVMGRPIPPSMLLTMALSRGYLPSPHIPEKSSISTDHTNAPARLYPLMRVSTCEVRSVPSFFVCL